jgi:tRNA modification GTPase
VRGIPVVFIDTAGLREAKDEIESEGIRRSRESLAKAELILHVLDASEPLHDRGREVVGEFATKKRIVVRNKTDLQQDMKSHPGVQKAQAGEMFSTISQQSIVLNS